MKKLLNLVEKDIERYYGMKKLLDKWYKRNSTKHRSRLENAIKEHVVKKGGFVCKKRGSHHFDLILKSGKYFVVFNVHGDVSDLPEGTHILNIRKPKPESESESESESEFEEAVEDVDVSRYHSNDTEFMLDMEMSTSTPVGIDKHGRDTYPVICSQCGDPTTVPFKPDGIRPTYCPTCIAKRELSGKSNMMVDKDTLKNLTLMKRIGGFKSIDELTKWMVLNTDLESVFDEDEREIIRSLWEGLKC